MCCFSRPVEYVSNTRIFTRMESRERQLLAYSMELDASEKLAMVLPIPVVKGAGEDAVQFINLKKYPELFEDIARGFPVKHEVYRREPGAKEAMAVMAAPLEVKSVGAFDASFVPTIADFSRLDERFRLPDHVWGELPAYADFGFAVFKLKPRGAQVHPMAFSFPTAMPDRLFFPTLHIHDGEIHPKEEFDHTLYCQGTGLNHHHWEESPRLAGQFAKAEKSQNLLLSDQHVYRKIMRGMLVNGDVTAKFKAVS